MKTSAWLNDVTDDEMHILTQGPIALGTKDEPEPDVPVVRGSPDEDPDERPRLDAVALIVEVADSSFA